MQRALDGIRILDLTQIMAGPFCTMLLADLGAEVIKVERPAGGDDSRRMGSANDAGDSLAFLAVNRNKWGIALDIRHTEGQAILRRLIESSDVLVENFRPGTMKRLGFDYDAVSQYRPDVVYCSISGYGQTGPYASHGGFDLVAQAMAGIISVTGTPENPAKSGVPLSDLNAGLFASHAILAALLYRSRTGLGQYVDTSLWEAALAYTIWETNEYWETGIPPVGLGTAHRNSAPYQTFRTANGTLALGAANQRNWEKLVSALGRHDLLNDPRFQTNASRLAHRQILEESLGHTFLERSTEEWTAILHEAGVPSGPVLNMAEVYAHPQTQARDMHLLVDHPTRGSVHAIGMPVKYSKTPGAIQRPAPLLGQHTFRILRDLGYSHDTLEELERRQVIRDAHWEQKGDHDNGSAI